MGIVSLIPSFLPILLGLWVLVSIPVYISAKIVTAGRAGFGQAMGATLLGPLSYLAVLFIANLMMDLAFQSNLAILGASILALLTWLWVFKRIFKTGWFASMGIAIIAIVVFIVGSIMISFAASQFMPEMPVDTLPLPWRSV